MEHQAYLTNITHTLQMPMHTGNTLGMTGSSNTQRIHLHLLQAYRLGGGLMKHVVRSEDPADNVLHHSSFLDFGVHPPERREEVVVAEERLEDTVQPFLVRSHANIKLIHALLQSHRLDE